MALDKQRILNELGSVMNQLQSADCGCMGKIFSHAPGGAHGGQGYPAPSTGYPLPTCGGCRRGHCHGHGYSSHSTPHAGEPYNTNHHCMGQCNPPKLYADTYNYLNQNLMQPVVKEVYDDLKSITPENTVMNNPIAQQMGLNQGVGQSAPQGGMGYQQMGNNQAMGSQQQGMTSMMGGMGPNIMNMMGDGNKKGANSIGNAGQLQQVHGQGAMPSEGHQQMHNPIQQNAINPYSQSVNGNMQQQGTPDAYHLHPTNPAVQQMSANKGYGKHSQGMTKFNEMFPGVTNNDLGFDPMSIAIQMNPANQQKAAMDTIHKIMTGENTNKVMNDNTKTKLQPAVMGANAVTSALAPPANNQQLTPDQVGQQASPGNPSHQQAYSGNQMPQQQICTAITGAPTMNQGHPQAQQQLVRNTDCVRGNDENPEYTNAPVEGNNQTRQAPTGYPAQIPVSEQLKQSIMPVDTNGNQIAQPSYAPVKEQKYYEYNTLGQPVELLPATLYNRPPPTNLPQTLSPQPVTSLRKDFDKFNVKSTMSKTALMGAKPVGRTPSRSQLQRIYNQYKGSQSLTQQNIPPPVHGGSYSARNLNVPNVNPKNGPVERVGGDTAANQISQEKPMSENPTGQVGNVPVAANKPHGDVAPMKQPVRKYEKLRNGLQDVVFSSYPSSQAWSFHGGQGAVRATNNNFRLR